MTNSADPDQLASSSGLGLRLPHLRPLLASPKGGLNSGLLL